MIIHYPEKNSTPEHSILSARIEVSTSNFPFPKNMWFSYPLEFNDFLFLRGDAFLAGMIIPAMAIGEDITVNAPVSPKLIYGLTEIQKILKIWFPDKFSEIQINAASLGEIQPGETLGNTASFFSGGVDSSFILHKNLVSQQTLEDFQIRNAIMVQGADIPLQRSDHFRYLVDISRQSLQPLDINLIPCSTNIRAFTEGICKWDYSHGAAIIASGLALSGYLNRLIIASSYNYRNLIPWGSSPLLDHWFSTGNIDVIHVGANYRRTDKLKVVANWEPAFKYLRVCPSTELENQVNCETCDKCLGTKAVLEMEGTLSKFKTFQRPFRTREYLRWAKNCHPQTIIPKFVLRKALIERRWSILPVIVLVYIVRYIKYWLDYFLPNSLRKFLRDRYFPLHENPFYAENIPK